MSRPKRRKNQEQEDMVFIHFKIPRAIRRKFMAWLQLQDRGQQKFFQDFVTDVANDPGPIEDSSYGKRA